MAEACDAWRVKAAPGKAFPQFSGSSGAKTTTIRLRDAYDPKPLSTKTPVRIRPPSPRPPSLSSESGTKTAAAVHPRDAAHDPRQQSTGKKTVRIRPQTPRPSTPRFPAAPAAVSDEAPAEEASSAWEESVGDPPTNAGVRRPRSKSLGNPLERSYGPWTRRQVRFVDSLGIELEDVKVFRVEDNPLIPQHVMSRLMMSAERAFGRPLELSMPYFKPCFPENMAAQPGFVPRLCRQGVCLEQVQCSEMGITGTAQVLDLAFEKEVAVHYSFTNWRICTDTKASWAASLPRDDETGGPKTDVFRFRLPVPPFILQPGSVLEFAISYRVKERSYWDNNDGRNYKLSCHSYKLAVPLECEDSMLYFT